MVYVVVLCVWWWSVCVMGVCVVVIVCVVVYVFVVCVGRWSVCDGRLCGGECGCGGLCM